jgi:RNA polymerase sigma-70 factor (ECF subfamily)
MDRERADEAHFLAAIEASQGALRRIARVYASDPAEREDLFQEILLALWRARSGFRGEATFSTYLYRVALNTALLGRRRAGRRPTTIEVEAEPSAPEAARTCESDEVEQLYRAIRALEPLDRALVLLALEERNHAEIADVTGLSVGNVAVRLSRCRERLRERLERGARNLEV